MKIYRILILMGLFIGCLNLNAQTNNMSFSAGLVTLWLTEDNPASKILVPKDSANFIFGGGFAGANSGISLRFNYTLDNAGKWNIPIGMDYIFFTGRQLLNVSQYLGIYLNNQVHMPSGSLGVTYNFMRFPASDVRAFIGADLRANFIIQRDYTEKLNYYLIDSIVDKKFNVKDDAFRVGGFGYIGFDGTIIKPLYINVSYGFGLLNMFGKNDERKELLSPVKLFESKENDVFYSQFYITLKYKF